MALSQKSRAGLLEVARRRGVTLIEAVLYIAIALALIIGGLNRSGFAGGSNS